MHDIDCITCGSTFIVEKIPQNIDENETIKEIPKNYDENIETIKISTGPVCWQYEVIDTIFVIDTLNKKFFNSTSPSVAFRGAKARLRERAVRQGGDAVINCTFDYRPSKGHSTFGASHDLEIFAYGTLVKRI